MGSYSLENSENVVVVLQVGVAGGFLLFFFLFCLHTKDDREYLDTHQHRSQTQGQ